MVLSNLKAENDQQIFYLD